MDEDNDTPTLSAHALLALNEFLSERNKSQKVAAQDAVSEDWQLSQFWVRVLPPPFAIMKGLRMPPKR